MAAPPGNLVAWGTITDDTPASLPVLVRRNADGHVIQYERVVSYLSVSATRGHPAVDDDEIELEVPAAHRAPLFANAFLAARRRALCATYPYLDAFLLNDPGTAPLHLPPNGQVSDQSVMSIRDEPPTTRATEYQAASFNRHVLAATSVCRDRPLPPPPAPAPEEPNAREYSPICQFCTRGTYFAPCCSTVFCSRCCRTHFRHAPDCAARRMIVPVMPRYPWGLRPLPTAFLLRPHPNWIVWQRRTGQNYLLASFMDIEDAVFYRDWRGIEFCTTLFFKDSIRSWAWVLVMEYRIRSTGPVVIRWRVYVQDRYAE